jgi:hypothetical protein
MTHYESEKLLRRYLLESGEIAQKQYDGMKDDAKAASVALVAQEVMGSLSGKASSVGAQEIDRSRGDLKQFREFPAVQAALAKLKSSIDGVSDYFGQNGASQAVSDIMECLANMSKHSNDFKEAYRDKKTAVILEYEALVMSIVQSVSYLIAVCTEAAKGDDSPVDYPELGAVRPLKAIRDFNDACKNGSFDAALRDVEFMRENYVEHGIDVLSTVTEASNASASVIDGFNNFVDGIEHGNRHITDSLYKAAAAVSLMLAMRDSVYTAAKMRNSLSDAIGNIKSYVDGFVGAASNRLKAYNAKLPQDMEAASAQAGTEIAAEDRSLSSEMKSAPERPAYQQSEPEEGKADRQPAAPEAKSDPGFINF